ncbi:hypothetical protein ACFS7Z_07645 [Pontibacter toksunensis]|uniref:Uncharacterized protein n=1 Tax=Pontibacter toksunensis TaxID=1332631 RepID=A0ABW6BR60_9BACT
MEREESRTEESHNKKADADTQHSTNSAARSPDGERTADASDVVKDENIPVVYIDTTPDIPIK